jgi:hypothetical protein
VKSPSVPERPNEDSFARSPDPEIGLYRLFLGLPRFFSLRLNFPSTSADPPFRQPSLTAGGRLVIRSSSLAWLLTLVLALPAFAQSPPLRISDRPSEIQPRPLPPNFRPSQYRSIVPPPSMSSRRADPLPSGFPVSNRQLPVTVDPPVTEPVAVPVLQPVVATTPATPTGPGRWLGPPPWMKAGQAPPSVASTGTAEDALVERLLKFPPAELRLDRAQDRWQIVCRGQVIKDCGSNQADGQDCLRFIRMSGVNARGIVGSPGVALEYWLSDGYAPPRRNLTHQEWSLEPASLRVESFRGHWWLRDNHNFLVNFGTSANDAAQALKVCHRYKINRLGQIGRQRPVLVYLASDPNLPPGGGLPPAPTDPARVGVLPQLCQREAIDVPGLGPLGEKVRFDPQRVEAASIQGNWTIEAAGRTLARFGNDQTTARLAARLIRDYRLTESAQIGDGEESLRFLLCDGAAPMGVRIGAKAQMFQPGLLQVLPAERGTWVIRTGSETLWRFASEAEARQALAVVRAYGFDAIVQVRSRTGGGLSFPVRTH